MTVRGFLLWYLGAVTFVGVAGASGYQAMERQHAENSAHGVAVAAALVSSPAAIGADAQPQAAAPSANPSPLPAPAPRSAKITALPPLHPPVAAAAPPAPVTHQPSHRAVAEHHTIHRPVAVAAVPRVIPRYQAPPNTAAYPPPPPPRPATYGYPGYYVYRGGYAYYSYYPRYGYYPAY
jgi:hypothetical protein